ncbi:U box domain [Macleaya cordata]|uniref:RING-type E3 ubiquitin transferase n=1 Tax=Macleaya cordata TaxID=56857 RepID=A0A200QRH3_MACCD|nr:U box domain [Macleaya cordata]
MASPSLEDLLSEEGFKGGKLNTKSRLSFGSKAVSMPLYRDNEQNQLGSGSSKIKIRTDRTRSDMSRYKPRSENEKYEQVRSRKPRDNLVGSERIARGLKEKDLRRDRETEITEEIGSNEIQEFEKFHVRLTEDFSGNDEVVSERRRSDVRESERIKDKFSNELRGESGKGKDRDRYSNGFGERQKHKEKSNKHIMGDTGFSDFNGKNLQQPESSYSKSNRSSQNGKILENLWSGKLQDIEQPVYEPALDEVAIQATVSILNGHIKHFLKDENFRESLRENCISCLNSIKLDKEHHADSKVIASLEQAMETVERVTEEYGNAKELKKASLQLSFITSLNSRDLEDGYTSGFPYSQLSACAHLYLSVIYKLQKKDRVSAKHLLQVFCDSPSQARKVLLPGLWDYLFLPHLSHLGVWYDKEEKSIPDSSSGGKKKKHLQKVYNELLDSGTYQFAAYYKDWLTDGVEAPSLPCIQIPSMPVRGVSRGGSHGHSPQLGSPVSSVSSQPMISKKLYDAVFGSSNKLDGVHGVEDREEQESFKSCMTIVDVIAEEDKRTLIYSPECRKYNGQLVQEIPIESAAENVPNHVADELLSTTSEGWRSNRASAPREEERKDEVKNIHMWRTIPEKHGLRRKKANELILKKLAESVFQQQRTEDLVDPTAAIPISPSKDMPVNDSNKNEESFFSNIPKEFICPITGELFEDPVTLETGQTFDRIAIKDWFDQGNRTCPVTGRILECHVVPITNFVLKRVIDSWKSEHCRNLLAFASQIEGSSSSHGIKTKDERAILILEQLLFNFRAEERLMNAKHLISLGGLQFLIRRFELGSLEEKARIAALLSCCIEADGACRKYLAKNIKKTCLLELLYNKQVKTRTNAVLLLTELICLNRRTEVTSFLSSLQKEGTMNTMHVLLVYLQSCSPDQKPLVAVLLLHFDLLVEPQKYSIYREEAVDSITVALDCSLTDEKLRQQCCRALLILAGQFSFSGEVLTENWCLRQAGFYDKVSSTYSLDNVEECFLIDKTIPLEEEEKSREEWWKNLAASLLGNGKKPFLEIISKCLGSENLSLVRTCMITVAWMSQALTLLSQVEFQLFAFSALVPRLKQILENGERIEHRVLASMSILNFAKISGQ